MMKSANELNSVLILMLINWQLRLANAN